MKSRIFGCFGVIVSVCFGIGAVEFDSGGFSVAISRAGLGGPSSDESGVAIRAFPHAFLDERFVLSREQPGLLLLAFSNREGVAMGSLTAFIELPEWVDLLGIGSDRQVVSREAAGDRVRYAIDATPTKGSITARGYNVFGALVLVLRTDAVPGTESAGVYWLKNDDYTSPKRSLTFGVIPRIEGDRPKRFETGVHFTGNCMDLSGEALDEFSRFYAETGCNAAMVFPGPMSQHFRQMKITRYHQPGWLVNGCMIGTGPRPDTVKFELIDGSKASNGVCPAVIYRREQPYFGEHVEAPLREILVEDRDTDHFLCNWEPFMFDFKGCFCERCRRDFTTYADLSSERVGSVWPGKVTEQYRDVWIAFRAWQNAELVKTIDATVNSLGREIGREAHFVPEVHIKSITPLWRTSDSLRQYATMAYAAEIPLLNAWGPYPWQTVMQPYNYVRGYNLSTHCLTRDSVDYLRAQIPEAERPRLMGFPHGLQGNLWTTEPESMAMDILTIFLNEYDGQLVYAFPKGYDARYWRALADANTAIAAFEDFTLEGIPQRSHSVVPITPYPAPSPRFLEAPCGGIDAAKWADASMLQSWEYRLGDRRLIAVANYWQRGECFARLRIDDLTEGGTYTLYEPLNRRIFGDDSGVTGLGSDVFGEGISVHVGAQRFAFFVVSPSSEDVPVYPVVCPADISAAQAARLPAIRTAFASEKRELSTADYARMLRTSGRLTESGFVVECSGNGVLKRETLWVRCRRHSLEIDVLAGGRITSWTVEGTDLVSKDRASGLALDALWYPAKMLTGPMELVSREIRGDRAAVVLRMSSIGGLAGLDLEKTITVERDTAAFTVSTRLHNTGEGTFEISHRYHNMPVFLESRAGVSGHAVFDGSAGASFSRGYERHMFTVAGAPSDTLLSKAFEMGRMTSTDGGCVLFEAPWVPVRVRAELPDADLHSVVFWDSQSMSCATFEPIHSRITVAPGGQWQTGMRWCVADAAGADAPR